MKRKPLLLILPLMLTLNGCGNKQTRPETNIEPSADASAQTDDDSVMAMTKSLMQAMDSANGGKSLNDIRFEGWDDDDWLDNEYIRTLRRYLDDYLAGRIEDVDLDPYKNDIRGKFVLGYINSHIAGGVFMKVIFLNSPNKIFDCWVYSDVDPEKEIVKSYSLRYLNISQDTTGMTKEDLLNAIKETEGVKLW